MFAVGLFYLVSSERTGGQGFSWQIITKGTFIHEPRFSHVFFFNGNSGIVLSGSTIETTHDGGKNWNTVPQKYIQGFYSLRFTDKKSGWIVGSEEKKPLVFKTDDQGLNWQKVKFDEKSLKELEGKFTFFSDICFDTVGKTWIVGNGGIVEAVTDRQNWKIFNIIPANEILHSVSCTHSGEVWAVGNGGAVFHYKDGWSRKEIDTKYVFKRVISTGDDIWILGENPTIDSNLMAAVSRRGLLLRSRDRGQTWENKTPDSAPALSDLFLKEGKGWLVGAKGNIFYSTDNGNSWSKFRSPTENDLDKIFFLDSDNGWIVGDRAVVLRYHK